MKSESLDAFAQTPMYNPHIPPLGIVKEVYVEGHTLFFKA